MKTNHSQKYFQKAKKLLVGGVNSPVRSFNSVGGNPLIMKNGLGAKLTDYDKNVYTDYCLSWGALILGHANKNVSLAIQGCAKRGTSFGTTTKEEIALAEHIMNCVTSIKRIRFVNSGTEATMSAIRLSRGFTKKDVIVKFDGCYHGHYDDLLTNAGSGVSELKESSSKGVPKGHIENTISLPYNDIAAFKQTISKHKDKIACVILEPVAGNMGVIPADIEFLKVCRDLTKKNNIVLIFDEVMSGFRTSAGSIQSEVNIVPDITCLGKIIGGGFPVGAYGGRKDIMSSLAPLGDVYQAGTFSGNPIVMKTGLAVLEQLNKDLYNRLNAKCAIFTKQVNEYLKDNGINAHFSNYKSMMSVRFRKEAVRNYSDAKDACGGKQYEMLFKHLLRAGIYWPPAELETFFVSSMHTKNDLKHLLKSIKSFFK